MMSTILQIFITLVVSYVLLCGLLFVFQEKLIFFPQKLNKNFNFTFDRKFEEISIKTHDGILLNGLLFKSDRSNGLIYYLHGNAGSLDSWGEVAKIYTDLNYDVFMLDYRGFGKSEGSVSSEEQFYQDVQIVYDEMKKRYDEENIIILGYSIGTGPATKIASMNSPKLLILQAPYYNLKDLLRHTYHIIPVFLLRYEFETNEYIRDCKMPIAIFHGDQDEVIYYKSSIKLKKLLKDSDKLIILRGQRHNDMSEHPDYKKEIQTILTYKTFSAKANKHTN